MLMISTLLVSLFSSAVHSAPTLPLLYQTYSAQEKRDILWENILNTRYDLNRLPTDSPGADDALKMLSVPFLRVTGVRNSDELSMMKTPWGKEFRRPKVVHKNGSVALIKWLPNEEQTIFGGLFQEGASGLIRASLAGTGYTPGVAVKWLVDGQSSLNLQLMNSLDGQMGCQFFAKTFSNSLPEPKNPILKVALSSFVKVAKEFQGPDATGGYLPVGHWGNPAPHHIELVPSLEAQKISGDCKRDFRLNLSELKAGQPLYHVWGFLSEHSSERVYLGRWILESDFVPSEFGDKVLHFQHHF